MRILPPNVMPSKIWAIEVPQTARSTHNPFRFYSETASYDPVDWALHLVCRPNLRSRRSLEWYARRHGHVNDTRYAHGSTDWLSPGATVDNHFRSGFRLLEPRHTRFGSRVIIADPDGRLLPIPQEALLQNLEDFVQDNTGLLEGRWRWVFPYGSQMVLIREGGRTHQYYAACQQYFKDTGAQNRQRYQNEVLCREPLEVGGVYRLYSGRPFAPSAYAAYYGEGTDTKTGLTYHAICPFQRIYAYDREKQLTPEQTEWKAARINAGSLGWLDLMREPALGALIRRLDVGSAQIVKLRHNPSGYGLPFGKYIVSNDFTWKEVVPAPVVRNTAMQRFARLG